MDNPLVDSPLAWIVGAFLAFEVFKSISDKIRGLKCGPIKQTITTVVVAAICYGSVTALKIFDQYTGVRAPSTDTSSPPSALPTPTPIPVSIKSQTLSGRSKKPLGAVPSENAQPVGVQILTPKAQPALEQEGGQQKASPSVDKNCCPRKPGRHYKAGEMREDEIF